MATITRKALKLGVVAGTLPAAAIALGYRMRAVQAGENSQDGSRVYRTCDLPIYRVANKEAGEPAESEPSRNAVEEQIRSIRIAVQDLIAQYKGTYEDAKQTIDIGVEHSKSTLDFVQNNPGELPRVAFITVGSLGGFILGYRCGILRKLLYGTVAGVACAGLCYPQYTLEVSEQASQQIKEGFSGFSTEELMKGNWPFVQDTSVDEENRDKLGLPKDVKKVVKELSNASVTSPPTPVEMKGDPELLVKELSNAAVATTTAPVVAEGLKGDVGQANPEDTDMYSTRSS